MLVYGVVLDSNRPDVEKNRRIWDVALPKDILKVCWVDRITNEEMLQRMIKSTERVDSIRSKSRILWTHNASPGENYSQLHVIIPGKIMARRSVGRRTTSWVNILRMWLAKQQPNCFRQQLKHRELISQHHYQRSDRSWHLKKKMFLLLYHVCLENTLIFSYIPYMVSSFIWLCYTYVMLCLMLIVLCCR